MRHCPHSQCCGACTVVADVGVVGCRRLLCCNQWQACGQSYELHVISTLSHASAAQAGFRGAVLAAKTCSRSVNGAVNCPAMLASNRPLNTLCFLTDRGQARWPWPGQRPLFGCCSQMAWLVAGNLVALVEPVRGRPGLETALGFCSLVGVSSQVRWRCCSPCMCVFFEAERGWLADEGQLCRLRFSVQVLSVCVLGSLAVRCAEGHYNMCLCEGLVCEWRWEQTEQTTAIVLHQADCRQPSTCATNTTIACFLSASRHRPNATGGGRTQLAELWQGWCNL